MLHVVNFSGGLCSFWAAHRIRERHGSENIVLLFADTLIEDGELYDFNERAASLLGISITRVSVEKDPWTLFREEGLIGNSLFPICSVRLKREPLNSWFEAHCLDAVEERQDTLFGEAREPGTMYLGFDWNEPHRLIDFRREHPTWHIEAPMTEEPIWDKCRMEREARARGLPIPKLYGLGFPHNNCGGRCVRAGISHWVHLYRVLRDRFMEWAIAERDTAADFVKRGIEPLSILKDRRGGVIRPLWLLDLAVRIDAGEKFSKYEWGGCGCGGSTQNVS